ncbi:MAG: response regulator, partial [Bacteroidales bacterium]|nr:response regulator [Bacteroidales bacterium]
AKKIKIYLFHCLIILAFSSHAQRNIFINSSLEEGLPQSSVLALFQDYNGNIWIGTQGGVSKYNGNSFTTFDTRHGMGSNHITFISQDKQRRYWFGHRYEGLSVLKDKKIVHFDITDTRINVIKEDPAGNIWIGTSGKGIYILPSGLPLTKDNFRNISDEIDLQSFYIYDIYIKSKNEVWLTSQEGICIVNFDNHLQQFKTSLITPETSNLPVYNVLSVTMMNDSILVLLGYDGIAQVNTNADFPFNDIEYFPFAGEIKVYSAYNIVSDNKGVIWGAHDKGVFQFKDGLFDYHFEGTGFSGEESNTIFIDFEDNIWIGTMNCGVFKYFGDKYSMFNVNTGLLGNVVLSIIEDVNNNIWIATTKGVCVYNGKSYTYYTTENGLLENSIDIIFEDSRGNIWMGNYPGAGLLRFNPRKKKFKKFTTEDGLLHNSVLTINEDKEGNIWFATLGFGVSKYIYPDENKPEKFETFTVDDGLCSNVFWTIYKDKKGNLWFGSDDGGLTKYDGKNFIIFNEKDGLTDLSLGAISHDSHNNLWIASIGGGIYKYDGKTFVNYGIADGLSSDSPFSIICDDNDKLWIGTNTGIDKFDPETEVFKHYGKEDGFLGIESNQNAICKSHDGAIWFGTINGVVRLDPAKNLPNAIPPVTVIENIKLFFSDFDYIEHSDYIDTVTQLPVNMELKHNLNHLTFEFVGVSHTASGKVNYQYKLENFDPGWNPVTKSTTANYTNIPAGSYIFKVRSCNSDGVWNEKPTTFNFTILPPFWKTTWFIVAAVIFILSLIILIFRLRIRNIKAQKIRLEKLVNEKTLELQEEASERKKAQAIAEQADNLKTAFLANMSHEIRTPVNAIIGFSDLLRDKNLNEKKQSQYLEYITGGGRTLLNLINDIIDISKIEAGQIRINKENCNLGTMMSELFSTFYEAKNKKGKNIVELRLITNLEYENLAIKTDPFRLKQIFSNLLGNAIKFTDTGYIEFGYRFEKQDFLEFFVKDTGMGIPEDKLEIVFHRFRQVEESYTRNQEGTGLGLSISRKLTELLGGEMWVESKSGEGATFYFTLPFEFAQPDMEFKPVKPVSEIKTDWKDKNILVVEDEESNYLLIESILKVYNANLIHVRDGNSAVDVFRNNGAEINLVLMDIKIPGLNGYEATREIKKINDKVPVIAQTAYAMAGEKEKCLSAGCDDYISKPYDRT